MAYTYRGNVHDLSRPLADLPEPEPKRTAGPPPFDPARCGTPYGTKQHQKHSQTTCEPCRTASRIYQAEWRAKKRAGLVVRRKFDPAKCGTYAGYHQHKRHGVDICDPCWQANADYMQAYRAKRAA